MGELIRLPAGGQAAAGEAAEAYLARPAEQGAHGRAGRAVVVIQEWWGLVGHIKRVVDRFAGEGFTAIAPDLYHGKTTRSPDEAGKLLMALDIARAEGDLRGAVDHLLAVSGTTRVGTVGFCMGGALSLFAACANGEKVGACVIYYGGHPKVQYDFDRLRAPVLGHWAERDDFANPNAERFEKEFQQRGVRYEFHRYAGTQHAFFNDDRPEVYDKQAAELSWRRTVDFLKSNI